MSTLDRRGEIAHYPAKGVHGRPRLNPGLAPEAVCERIGCLSQMTYVLMSCSRAKIKAKQCFVFARPITHGGGGSQVMQAVRIIPVLVIKAPSTPTAALGESSADPSRSSWLMNHH